MKKHSVIRGFFLTCFVLISPLIMAQNTLRQHNNSPPFDWQGHRGARGLMPENTIPAFLEALKYPVTTLELDIVISADRKIMISHEPWMNPQICLDPDGKEIPGDGRQFNLFQMTAAEIRRFDCGTKQHADFPTQQHLKVHKPTLGEMVSAVRKYCTENARQLPLFNIELKSLPAGYAVFVPEPEEFVALVIAELDAIGIAHVTTLQSFDPQVLREIHKQEGDRIATSYLTSDQKDLDKVVEELGFKPDVYSPYYRLVSKKLIRLAREKGMLVIPWTVNKDRIARRLIKRGVDGMITDYPDRIEGWQKYFESINQ